METSVTAMTHTFFFLSDTLGNERYLLASALEAELTTVTTLNVPPSHAARRRGYAWHRPVQDERRGGTPSHTGSLGLRLLF